MKIGKDKVSCKKVAAMRKSKLIRKMSSVKSSKKPAFKEDVKSAVRKAKDFITSKVKNKPGRKNKTEIAQEDEALYGIEEEDKKKGKSKQQVEAQIQFFYTNDKYFTQFDDKEIIASVQQKYPEFMKVGTSDTDLKHIIIDIIEDKKFVDALLELFNINIQEFFKFIFRCDTSIFKGQFLNKIQKTLEANGYDI